LFVLPRALLQLILKVVPLLLKALHRCPVGVLELSMLSRYLLQQRFCTGGNMKSNK
jgi:hypothetical protein